MILYHGGIQEINNQIAFCTDAALTALTFLESYETGV